MKRKFTLLIAALALLTMIVQPGRAWGQESTTVASFSRSGTINTTTGGEFTATFSAKTGYYQDVNGDCYMQILNTSAYWTTTPTSISFAALIGGGSGNTDLTDPVYVALLDENGAVISGTQTTVTSHITTNTGDNYNISIPVTNNVYGVKLSHNKQTGYNVRYYSFSMSYVAGGGSTTTPTTVTIDASGITNNDIHVGTAAGSLTATVKDNNNTTISEATVTWTSSNTNAATINNNGEVTLVAAGTTIITASYAGNSTYSPSSATYNLEVVDNTPSSDQWVLTNLADLTADDVFVIVGNNGSNYAMANDNGTGSAPAAVSVIVANNEITSTVAANIQWNISENGTDGYTFYPNGSTTTWLYCTNANNGIRVGTNDDKAFTLHSSGYLQHTTTSRFLGIYSSQDWRCYTDYNTNNIKNQTFAFYKKVTGGVVPPSISASNVNIAYNATNGSIAYTINNEPDPAGTLTAAVTDGDWLTLGTVGATVPFTCGVNPAATERAATVTLTYTYDAKASVTKDVTVTQAGNPDVYMTISEVRAQGTGSVTTKGIVTSCVGTTGYIQDNDAAICVYGSSLTVGDEIRVSGSLTTYNGLLEITSPQVTVVSSGNVVDPEVMTVAEVVESTNQGWYIRIENATVTAISGQNTTIAQGESTIVARGISGVTLAVNDIISLNGNIGCFNANQIANPQDVTVQQPTEPTITLSSYAINAPIGGANGTLTVTYENITDVAADVWFCDAAGENDATYDWVTAEINTDNNVYYLVEENNGEARTAYFKVYALDDDANDVYSNLVTINQDEYIAPTYATLPFEFDGGRANIAETDGLYEDGLGSDYGSSPKLKFDNTGDWLLLQFDERPGTLTFDIKNNSFSGGTFTVQTSEDGATYTDLENYTTITGTQNEEFDNLGENVRYIKWIYTNKSSGNVGLGNIGLTAYVAPVPSIEAEDVDIACDATEGVITYTVTNPASDGNLTAEITDGNEGYWLTLGTIGANVPFTCTANTGAERTATVTLTYTYNTTETVTATAVVTQAAYVVPTASIVVTPTEVNATAAETEDYLGIDYTALTITESDDFGIQFYDSNNQELNGDDEPDWITAEATTQIGQEGYFVYYYISANTGAARMAYFKVWALDDNSTAVYSNLVTVTQAAGSTPSDQYVRINDLGSLTDGAKVIIAARYDEEHTNGYYAMPGQTSGKPTGVTFTSENSGNYEILPASITDSEDTYYWTVNVTDDGYTFTNANNQMIGWTNSTNFATGGNNTEWTITRETAEETAMVAEYTGFVITNIYTTTTTTTRAFAFNGEKFGPYGTSNMTSATYNFFLDFFVQGATPVVTPSITINPGPYDLNSEGGDAVLPVTYTNMPTDPQAEVIFYESDGETPLTENPTWITANINNDGNVAGHIDANDGDARSAYFKVKGIDANENPVYSALVTINQAAYTLSIEFETTEVDIEAGGEQDRIISFEYQGLGENPTFEVRTYDVTGETQTTYDWLTTSITQGHKVSINVAENTGDARSAYFKVYGENGTINTESNLVTINQAAAAPAGETFTLLTNVDQIVAGQHYLITNGSNKAMGVQNSNNRAAADVTISAGTATYAGDDVYEVVISGPDANGNYSIYDQRTPGYLFAASSESNYLRTRAENSDNNSMWKITIDNEGVASIIAQGSNSRKVMQYNGGNSIFACYGSASQSAVYLYKKVGDTNPVYYSPTEIAVANPDPTSEPIIVVNNEILVLTGNLDKCNNPDNLIVEDGGQLVFDGTGVKATMKKKTVGESKAEHWYTIASPVNNIDFANITNLTNAATFDLYRYDEATYTWENYKNTAHTDFVTAENGRGYLYYNSDGNELSFAGELNNSASYDLTASGAQMNGLNLIGNPFTQDITLANISLSDDAQISEGFYVLSNNSDWVASVTTVKPCEGFIVKVNKATTATFSKSTGSSKSRANRDYIAFTVANNQYEDVAYAMFSNGLGLDKIDHRNADIPMVYIPQNGQNYAIATMDDNTQAFELNFKAMTTGQYTLSYKAEGKYSYLHVIDRLTGEDIDMLLDGEYSFIGSPRDNEARFIVKLSYNANIEEIEVNDNFAYQNGSDIIVNGNGELQVFDVTGRMVMNTKINGIQTVNVPATGMYIFRMVGESVQTQKIVVR